MIRLYQADERSYTANNGDVILKPILALVRCEDNGAFTLDLETDLTYADWLVQDAVVVVPTPDGDQPFRLNNPIKTGKKIKIMAKHVSYDAERLLIADSYVVSKNCQEAMQHLNAATDVTSPFTMSSDITAVNSYRCVRKSLWEGLKVVLERWGGHLKRDGFTISILASLEKDNGAVIRTGKNLKELTQTENWDNVCTKLLPVGKDGTLLNLVDASASVYISGRRSYKVPYTRTKSFDQEHINREDYATDAAYNAALVADLRAQAVAYLRDHETPEINYTLAANLDKVDGLGDVIHVTDTKLGLELLTQVTAYEYDAIQRKITSLEFGNHKKTLSGLIPDIIERTKEEA